MSDISLNPASTIDRFSKLPLELRLQILECCLTFDTPIVDLFARGNQGEQGEVSWTRTSALRVNRFFRHEGLKVFHRSNVFLFTDSCKLQRVFTEAKPPREAIALFTRNFRHLMVKFNCAVDRANTLLVNARAITIFGTACSKVSSPVNLATVTIQLDFATLDGVYNSATGIVNPPNIAQSMTNLLPRETPPTLFPPILDALCQPNLSVKRLKVTKLVKRQRDQAPTTLDEVPLDEEQRSLFRSVPTHGDACKRNLLCGI